MTRSTGTNLVESREKFANQLMRVTGPCRMRMAIRQWPPTPRAWRRGNSLPQKSFLRHGMATSRMGGTLEDDC